MFSYLTKLFHKQMQITEEANQDAKQKTCNQLKALGNASKRGHDWFNLVDRLKRQYICTDLLQYASRFGFQIFFSANAKSEDIWKSLNLRSAEIIWLFFVSRSANLIFSLYSGKGKKKPQKKTSNYNNTLFLCRVIF